MERLEQEEIATEAAVDAAYERLRQSTEQLRQSQSKLCRLRKQKKFLKDCEKRLFDKGPLMLRNLKD